MRESVAGTRNLLYKTEFESSLQCEEYKVDVEELERVLKRLAKYSIIQEDFIYEIREGKVYVSMHMTDNELDLSGLDNVIDTLEIKNGISGGECVSCVSIVLPKGVRDVELPNAVNIKYLEINNSNYCKTVIDFVESIVTGKIRVNIDKISKIGLNRANMINADIDIQCHSHSGSEGSLVALHECRGVVDRLSINNSCEKDSSLDLQWKDFVVMVDFLNYMVANKGLKIKDIVVKREYGWNNTYNSVRLWGLPKEIENPSVLQFEERIDCGNLVNIVIYKDIIAVQQENTLPIKWKLPYGCMDSQLIFFKFIDGIEESILDSKYCLVGYSWSGLTKSPYKERSYDNRHYINDRDCSLDKYNNDYISSLVIKTSYTERVDYVTGILNMGWWSIKKGRDGRCYISSNGRKDDTVVEVGEFIRTLAMHYSLKNGALMKYIYIIGIGGSREDKLMLKVIDGKKLEVYKYGQLDKCSEWVSEMYVMEDRLKKIYSTTL